MESKHIKVDKLTNWKNVTPIDFFPMFLTMALSPVPPGFSRAPHTCEALQQKVPYNPCYKLLVLYNTYNTIQS